MGWGYGIRDPESRKILTRIPEQTYHWIPDQQHYFLGLDKGHTGSEIRKKLIPELDPVKTASP